MPAITLNFDFLEEEFLLLHNLGKAAEYNLHQDAGTSLMKLRQFVEHLTELIYETLGMDFPEDKRFVCKLRKLSDEKILPDNVSELFADVRIKGNSGSSGKVGGFRFKHKFSRV